MLCTGNYLRKELLTTMAIIAGTTIEYETKKHDEITSAYSYAKYVTGWKQYEYGVAQNPVCKWNYPTQTIHTETGDSSVYADILWLYDPVYVFPEANILINAQSTDTLNVITKLDIQKYKLKIKGFRTLYASDSGESNTINTRSAGYTLQTNENILDVQYCFYDKDDPATEIYDIYPVLRYSVNGEIWYFRINTLFSCYIRNVPTDSNKLTVVAPDGYYAPHDESILLYHSPVACDWQKNMPSLNNAFLCGSNDSYNVVFNNVSNGNNSLYSLASSIDTMLHVVATLGIYFEYNGTMYLGFMDATGQTTGEYLTEDEWETSAQWNAENINNYSQHNPPYVPPSPSEDAEAETFGWSGNEVGGMARYYLLTSAEMESLADFMSDPLWTIDYRNCIISMFIVPNSGGLFDAVEPTTIKFKLDDNQKVDTGVSALRISGVNPNTSATIEIPRMNDNFLDFEPYSKYLLYIPFCGVIQLPDYVAGKEINVKLYPDVPTCSCTAIVTSDDRKIATVRGNIGSSIPVTSDGSGIKTAAVINSMANGIVGVGEAVMGASTGNVGMVAGGAAQALGSVLSTTVTLGQAFGYSVGSSGDTSFFGAGTRCEYYIAYPKWNNPDTSETNIYGHTFGFVVNKRGKLKDFEGFTVCDNPHVYGFSCTAAEKEEIEMLLRQGIIIHLPSE